MPHWWRAEYRQFRRSYLPRSESWPPLWDYDATLKRLFRPPQPSAHGPGRPGF